MNLTSLNRSSKVTNSEMKELSNFLISHLSDHLNIKLSPFKRHIVEGESFVCNVYGEFLHCGPFDFRLEGAILLQLRDSSPPSISAELFVFSRGERIGMQRHGGGSFLPLHLLMDRESLTWETKGWLNDGPDDWGMMTQLRSTNYIVFEDTWEDNE